MAVSRARLRTLFATLAVLMLVLSLRVSYWQTLGRAELLARATDQVRSDLVIPAQRGTIRDRNGAILATSVALRSVYAIPSRIEDVERTSTELAILLGRDVGHIRAALTSGAEWIFLARRVPETTASAIAALGRKGIGFEDEPKRLYPNEDLAAHVLGFVSDDGLGQSGVEGRYDRVLRGVDGRLVVERDTRDRALAVGLRQGEPPRHGADLTLTLDLAIQTAAERELQAAIKRERAAAGAAVVLDPRDGAILALASAPTFHPGGVAVADPETLRDRAISWTYEPGSTLKTITMAAGLEEKAVTPSSSYQDVGYAVIGGRRLANALGKVWGPTNMTQVLERSANAGAVFVGSKLGARTLHDYLLRFGLGSSTGVDLAGEAGGRIRPLAEWYPVDVGTASFGQGLAVTPLQLAAAYAAVANGGTLYRPYVVAAWHDADGEHRTEPVAERRVVSAQTAATLRDMLVSAVDNGLAANAKLTSFSVAGKTGTAQIPSDDGRYADDEYISSFAGFVPAHEPRFVVVIVLERPRSKLLGTLPAMSAFKGIAQDVLRYARVQPDR